MKIFLLVSSFPGQHNKTRGAFNFKLVKQMLELKHDVFVIFFRTWLPGRKFFKKYLYCGISVTQLCLPQIPLDGYLISVINTFLFRKVGGILLKRKIVESDIIHSVSLTSNGIIAGQWAKEANIPHISQAIGSDVNSDLPKLIKEKRNLKWLTQIDGIIANSKGLEGSLKTSILNCPPVKTIYRGVRIDNLKENKSNQDKFIFLYLGGLVAYRTLPFTINTKGGITLMEAWKKAETKLFNNSILLFGGPDSNKKIFNEWKKSLRYPERVELIGKVLPENINQVIADCNIVIVPSMEEGLPNFLLESAAQKKAAIGSNAGGIPEAIINKETGYIFEKGNIEQLADLLVYISYERENIKKMGEAAYERVKDNFNSENYSKNILNFYKKIMNKCAE